MNARTDAPPTAPASAPASPASPAQAEPPAAAELPAPAPTSPVPVTADPDRSGPDHQQFVDWLRMVAPYIHAFRGKTFVIAFAGELVKSGVLNALVNDVALLHAMGMQIVLVHGSRPQVEEQLALRQVESQFVDGVRVTDNAALECAKEAAGELRLDIEAAFSQGLPNTPMAGAQLSVISGNFVTARPVGIVNGTDYQHTGLVRKIDAESVRMSLSHGKVVLLSPLGFSPTGQAFNLSMEDVASATATALKADKLIFITEVPGVPDPVGKMMQEMSLRTAVERLQNNHLPPDVANYLQHLVKALKGGVPRAHLIPYSLDGAVLLELFLHDGVGTMLSDTDLESLREATLDDVGGIVQLIAPLEQDGTLVPRGRHLIERDIGNFSVIEHDGVLFGCAALYDYPRENMGEMACLTVSPEAQGTGDGERLLKRIERRARALGLERLFVLTTRTEHWFLKRGFVHATVDDLPEDKRKLYNWQRKSMVLMKKL
ncbi:Amino-acid acetyltransferase (N-acetylglutamate synthase) [Cupriavidus taiwanensis]|uniref:Amino-acid acetyltransferase n=1 Tax=Cupriavidus taiwanensis TaxID=164546 RepID=A0A375DZX5_9BURK|nr:amino-acid N-acetyltransferase [Cupriavidus taiwanensis]SOZ52675.1 Amino-acid acetyltransferase (N-acetylglutamate synthase) [Cupriavidus taiwanensis]SOZ54141.1 Amino-acid acetyltransferase (N-acetylglutamate synthase) [Cupriavidus taiwanensis]SOZ56556.1 Amino-acid acetyltransferase (N-acetylglutamate synthase) [Cupriavidus taiwanensis]SOZ97955.1 Amino-acid acetyltransferase (N-acetylglutamate synthase) [Cupriavidus taiwanensis]SPA04837.1 Amino-acid acetyltransferase (N-acetylglutamate synt